LDTYGSHPAMAAFNLYDEPKGRLFDIVAYAKEDMPWSRSVRDVFFCSPGRISLVVMKPQDARVGMRVKVQDHHRIEERRGLVGRVVGCYGEEHIVVDVRFADGRSRLFWPADLEEVELPRRWWRSLLGIDSAEY
jgi:hypothetical protein